MIGSARILLKGIRPQFGRSTLTSKESSCAAAAKTIIGQSGKYLRMGMRVKASFLIVISGLFTQLLGAPPISSQLAAQTIEFASLNSAVIYSRMIRVWLIIKLQNKTKRMITT